MTEIVLDIIGILLGSLGIGSLIVFFVTRHDNKKGWEAQLKKLEKDIIRTQLLLLMKDYDEKDESELMACAEHYFVDLKGNWYLTPKFYRFIKEQNIATPEWFD